MSILAKLNPLKWIKGLLISDYVGGWFRHALTGLGAILIAHKLGTDVLVEDWVRATIALITSSEFLTRVFELATGASAVLGGLAASAKNKNVP